MISAISGLIAAHFVGLGGGASLSVITEMVIPILTKAHRARKAANILRDGYAQIHGTPIPRSTLDRVRFDPDLSD